MKRLFLTAAVLLAAITTLAQQKEVYMYCNFKYIGKSGFKVPDSLNCKWQDLTGDIELEVWPGKVSSFDLYETDTLNAKHTNSDYVVRHLTTQQTQGGFIVNISKPEGKFKPVGNIFSISFYWNGKLPIVATMNDHFEIRPGLNNDIRGSYGWLYYKQTSIIEIMPLPISNLEKIEISSK